MAVNNRVEAEIAVDAQMVATITAEELRDLLNDELINSLNFRKDVIATETPAAGSVVIDYIDKDTATVTTAVNLSISFTNIENGDVKYLHITKAATNTLVFTGATNVTNFQKYINNNTTVATYAVYSKNGVIYVMAIVETIIEAVLADIQAADLYKFTTAKAVNDYVAAYVLAQNGGILTKVIDIGDWNMDTTTTPGGIAHGLDVSKIRGVRVLIRDDIPLISKNLLDQANNGNMILVSTTNIVLSRETGGIFDSAVYDSTSYNRGWIIIDYIA